MNRVESGEMPLNRKDSDLTTLAGETIKSLGGLTAGRDVSQESPDGSEWILAVHLHPWSQGVQICAELHVMGGRKLFE